MGFMEKMRGATGPVLWVLVFAFGILFMLQDTDVFSSLQAGPRSLGDVDGQPITQNDYNQRINAYTEQYTRETGNPPSIEERARFEEMVWDQLIVELALRSEMKKLGIEVTDRELIDAILGDNPDPVIRQNFGRPDGSIDRATLRALIEQPETQSQWIQLEDDIRQRRMQQKINQFMQSAIMVTNHEIEQDYIRTNTTADISFVRFPFSDISNSEVEVSDSEMQRYHRENAKKFEREKTWEFSYVSFSKDPTPADTLRTMEELAPLRDQFASTENDSFFVQQNFSATPYEGQYRSRDDVRPPYDIVFDMEVGEVSEPLVDENLIAIVKKTGERDDEVRYAVISRAIAADRTITVQQANAEDFREFARLEGFELEAEREDHTVNTAAATKGAPFIQGIGESRVIMRELQNLSRNNISPVIELDNKFVVIKVNRVMEKGVRPLDEVRQQVENAVRSEKRRDLMLDRVRDQYAGLNTLDEIAEQSERSVQTASNVRMNSNNISGAGREPGLVGKVFGSDLDTLKGPFKGDSAVFMVVVNERTDADLENLSSNERDRIRNRLTEQKNRTFTEQLVERLKDQVRVRDYRQQTAAAGF